MTHGSPLGSSAAPDSTGVYPQLRNAGDPCDGYYHTADDGRDQQRHPQWQGPLHTHEMHLNLHRILEDEHDEKDQEDERAATATQTALARVIRGGRPSGGAPADPDAD
jgi:hypothetical protein